MHPITTRHPSLEAQFREHEVKHEGKWRNYYLHHGYWNYGDRLYNSQREAAEKASVTVCGVEVPKSEYTVIQIPVAS